MTHEHPNLHQSLRLAMLSLPVLINTSILSAVKEQTEQIIALQLEYMKARNRILPSLPEADMSGYDFPLRPLHSEIGREILDANQEFYATLRATRIPTLSLTHK